MTGAEVLPRPFVFQLLIVGLLQARSSDGIFCLWLPQHESIIGLLAKNLKMF